MARAKRTARAEARRRHRASQVALDVDTELDDEEEPTAPAAGRPQPTTRPPAAAARAANAPQARPSLGSAFRQAFHPVDWRDDLRTFPRLILDKSVWLPILLGIGSTALYMAIPSSTTSLLLQYFVFPPPIGAVFLAGFLAPRSSWLVGIVVGLASVALFALVLTVGPAFTTDQAIGDRAAVIGNTLVLSTLGGAFFASAAAWYRRFLRLSNPNRGRPSQPTGRRGNDGRTRSARASARR